MMVLLWLVAIASAEQIEGAELPAFVDGVRQQAGAPIAVVTANRIAKRLAQRAIGEAPEVVYLQAGSPSEVGPVLRAHDIGCGLYVSRAWRRGDAEAWDVVPVGYCAGPRPVAAVPGPATLSNDIRRPPLIRVADSPLPSYYTMGVRRATVGIVLIPAGVGLFALGTTEVLYNDLFSPGLAVIGFACVVAAPPLIASGSVLSARAVRSEGGQVGRALGDASLAVWAAAFAIPWATTPEGPWTALEVGGSLYLASVGLGIAQLVIDRRAHAELTQTSPAVGLAPLLEIDPATGTALIGVGGRL